MKKIISINISGTSFFIDEDAYERLNEYLEKLKKRFCGKEEEQEIISDVETRIAELFAERINPANGVITIAIIDEVIQIMGRPEDFSDDETDEKSGSSTFETEFTATTRKRLYRDVENQILSGVCAGIAAYFNIDSVLVRIIFAILPFVSFGIAIPVYIVLWIVVPAATTTTQKMEMKGENITISNIEKKIKEEYEDVKKRFENFTKTNKTYKRSEEHIRKMNKRDRGILIAVGVFVILLILTKLTSNFHGHIHIMNLFPFTLFFPGFFQIAIVLLLLGLIFRSVFKPFVIVLIVLAAISIFIKIITWIFGGVFNQFFWW